MNAASPLENVSAILLHPRFTLEEIAQMLNETNKDGQLPINVAKNPRAIWDLLMEYFEECKFKKGCRYGWKCKYLHFSERKYSIFSNLSLIYRFSVSRGR